MNGKNKTHDTSQTMATQLFNSLQALSWLPLIDRVWIIDVRIGDRSWAASRPSRQQLGMPHLMRINKAQNSKKSITT